MSQIRELKNEATLSLVARNPEANQHYLLFGVIIDISEPYKTQDSTNYTTKLKIIDPSFNYKARLHNDKIKFHKFVHVNIYSETPDLAPRIQYVGDIIRLRRFRFKITEKGELMGNMQKYSNWLIYSGQKNQPTVSNVHKNYVKNKKRKLNSYELGRLKDLRNWNDSFFFKNSMQYITWWNQQDFKETHNEQVDLILKCDSIDFDKSKLFFVDEDGNKYQLQLKVKPNKILGKVIKLRCCNVTHKKKSDHRLIKLTPLSSCLIIPDYFYNSRKFINVKGGKQNTSKTQKTLISNFNFLNHYYFPTSTKKHTNVSVIKKTLSSNKVLTVNEMQKILKNPDKHINTKFVVKGYITGYADTNTKNIIKKLQRDTKKVSNMFEKQSKSKKQSYQALYNLVLMVQDHGSKKKDVLNVYLTTEDGGNHLFETWNVLPASNDMKAWNQVKQKQLNEFESLLKKMTKPQYEVNLGVQLLKTKSGKAFLKFVDTVFLPL